MRVAFGILAAAPLVLALPDPQRGIGRGIQPVCGVKGYDETTKAYFDVTRNTLSTVQACGAHCVADSSCLSFAVGSGACLHYTVAV
jgi:hypothetical protein